MKILLTLRLVPVRSLAQGELNNYYTDTLSS